MNKHKVGSTPGLGGGLSKTLFLEVVLLSPKKVNGDNEILTCLKLKCI